MSCPGAYPGLPMASNLSCLGFDVCSKDQFLDLAWDAVQTGEAIWCPLGTYHRWRVGEGVELWVHMDREGMPCGLTPFFHGALAGAVELGGISYLRSDNRLSGCFRAMVPGDERDGTPYPIVFEAPDLQLATGHLGNTAPVRMTVFAREIGPLTPERRGVADRSFIPHSVLHPDCSVHDQCIAFFTGEVLESGWRVNPVTSRRFAHTRMATLGLSVDIVADADSVENLPAVGNVIYSIGMFVGRVSTDGETSG